jgi:hypothetical protein
MDKKILLTAIISALYLAGCTTNNQTVVQMPDQSDESQSSIAIAQEDSEGSEADVITNQTDRGFLIPEIGIKISLPDEYAISKSDEINRRGSFVSYNFSNTVSLSPAFQEIQFFNDKSIGGCGVDGPCFFGDYPDLERYKGQRSAFIAGTDYGKYELEKFGERNYFVSNFKCDGDSCIIREYTTFINDTKVDIWIRMENDALINAADSQFREFEITE